MILGFVMIISYIVYLYFTEFRVPFNEYLKENYVRRRNSFWLVLRATYEFLFVVKSEDRLRFFKLIHNFSPRFYRMKFWKWDYVFLYDPELFKKVFNTQVTCQRPFRNCIQLEKGLLSSEYHYWKKSRKLLNGAFNLNVLKGFIPIYSFYADNIVKEMSEHVDGKEFDVLVPLAKLTARSIAATMLNVHGVEVSSYEKFISSVTTFLDLTFRRMIYPPLQYDFIYKMTKNYKLEKAAREFAIEHGDNLIKASREKKTKSKDVSWVDENGNVVEKAMKVEFIIDQLIQHEEKFTNEEIREHILILMITASETSARFVATTLMFLAIHQDVQDKVYQEICEVFGDDTENIDYEQLNSCRYLEMVMKESLRLFTPLPITARETLEKFDLGIGEPLEKGAKIILFNYILHRRRDLWGKNADVFDPENFSPENMSKRDPYCFVPFGAGPRNCIGNRIAMIAAKIETLKFIHAYKFNTKFKESDLKQGLSLTLTLSVDYLVSIESR